MCSEPFSTRVHAHISIVVRDVLDARVGLSSFVLGRIGPASLGGGLLVMVPGTQGLEVRVFVVVWIIDVVDVRSPLEAQ